MHFLLNVILLAQLQIALERKLSDFQNVPNYNGRYEADQNGSSSPHQIMLDNCRWEIFHCSSHEVACTYQKEIYPPFRMFRVFQINPSAVARQMACMQIKMTQTGICNVMLDMCGLLIVQKDWYSIKLSGPVAGQKTNFTGISIP